MSELLDKIKEAEDLNRQMRKMATGRETDDHMEVIRLRSRYSKSIIGILQAKDNDGTLSAQPAKRQDFDRLFGEMRQALSQHQGKWSPRVIEKDPVGYKNSAVDMNKYQDAFFSWCRTNLS